MEKMTQNGKWSSKSHAMWCRMSSSRAWEKRNIEEIIVGEAVMFHRPIYYRFVVAFWDYAYLKKFSMFKAVGNTIRLK